MNYFHFEMWDEITYPFQTSTFVPLKFGGGYVNSSHILPGMYLIILAGI